MSKQLKDGLPLEASALEWLRYQRQCTIVMMERGTRVGRPDVLGVTDEGFGIEVECKRSIGDLKKDAEKGHRAFPEHESFIRQLYYMVHPSIVEKALPLVPLSCGVMTVNPRRKSLAGMPELVIRRNARTRKLAVRLTESEKWRIVRDMSGTLVSSVCFHPSRRRWDQGKEEPA